jgi:hypothetical protein
MTGAQTCPPPVLLGFPDLKETTAEYKVARGHETDFIDQKELSFIIIRECIVI